MKLELHTVILLVGPKQSGKTTWASLFQKEIKKIEPKIQTTIIDVEEHEKKLLQQQYIIQENEEYEKMVNNVHKKIIQAMTFPHQQEFIIVDALGFHKKFQDELKKTVEQYNYKLSVVAFDVSDKENKEIRIFKNQILPSLEKKTFYPLKKWMNFEESYFYKEKIEIQYLDLWKKTFLNQELEWAIIGDIHEHVDSLQLLLNELPHQHLLFLGDYLDKGNNTKQMIDFLEKLLEEKPTTTIIIGNHESFVARRLLNKIGSIPLEDEVFSSLKFLKNNEEYASKFLKIYEKSIPFAYYKNENFELYATHAPCHLKYLGKMNQLGQKSQRNFYFSDREFAKMQESLSFLEKDGKKDLPFHVFGHVAHQMDIEMGNKIWLDTGAVYGGYLTAMILKPNKPEFIQVKSQALTNGELFYFQKKNHLKY
jgi:predicted kinase